jgi:eukaryotic-like serine/threonine-protein kinase
MQLVRGYTLRDLLDRGPLDPGTVARIGTRLADALAYVHGRGVVHRDIKPSNVLVDEAGESHLTDFGVARALGSAHLTVSGELVGTAAYLAPEQITDIDVGPPADVYALGLLLLECLTGRTEYTGTTVEAALARLNRAPRIPDTLPPPWHTLLTAMTAQAPDARPDATRCADLLGAIADGRTTALQSPPPVTKAQPRSRLPRPRPAHAGLTALALAAACAVAITATTTTSGTPTSEPQPESSTSTAPETTFTSEPAPAPPPTTNDRAGPPLDERTAAVTGEHPGKGKGGKKNKGSGKGKSGGKG